MFPFQFIGFNIFLISLMAAQLFPIIVDIEDGFSTFIDVDLHNLQDVRTTIKAAFPSRVTDINLYSIVNDRKIRIDTEAVIFVLNHAQSNIFVYLAI